MNVLLVLLSVVLLAEQIYSVKDPVVDHGNGLKTQILKRSKTCKEKAEVGDKLEVHYVGKFPDGKVFDTSRNRNELYKFQLGAGEVIQGYELGVPGMCLGEKRLLIVPPHLAYGDQGVGPIPGGATLHFEVELFKLIKIVKKDDL